MDRFTCKVQEIKGIQEEMVLYALSIGLRSTFFVGDLVRKSPNTFAEAMERSHGESNVEDYPKEKIQELKHQQKHKGPEHAKSRDMQS